MPSNWFKSVPQLYAAQYLNSGTGDTVLGGTLSGVPSNVAAGAGDANRPGDRLILGAEDATALSDTTIGTLYQGMYQYVLAKSGSTGTATRGRAVWWDTAVADLNYQVTPDETGSQATALFAGVVITSTIAKGSYWWVQQTGRVFVRYKAAMTGTPADGQAIYHSVAGAGADLGTFDNFGGDATAITYTLFGTFLQKYVGVARGLPVNGGIATTVEIPFGVVKHRI